MPGAFTRFFDTLANMGVWIRLNDARTGPPTAEGRLWGEPAEGFVLSIAPQGGDTLSVLLKNVTTEARSASLPPWIQYFQVSIDAPLKPFGRRVLGAPYQAIPRTFPAGATLATDLPLAPLFDLRAGDLKTGARTVSLTCQAPGGSAQVRSNQITWNPA